jgi:alpha-L-fucosidase
MKTNWAIGWFAGLAALCALVGFRPNPPTLVKEHRNLGSGGEITPFVWGDRLLVLKTVRTLDFTDKSHLEIHDENGKVLARFGNGFTFGSALVNAGVLHVFATEHKERRSIHAFTSSDLKHFDGRAVIVVDKYRVFNTSVCATPDGFVMAYETDEHPAFSIRFAHSKDLRHWSPLPQKFPLVKYTACPTIRFEGGWYYLFYLDNPGKRFFTEIARSRDLTNWQYSTKSFLRPGKGEGRNTSDIDLCEYQGSTLVYYLTGDQLTWGHLRRATYNGTARRMMESYF